MKLRLVRFLQGRPITEKFPTYLRADAYDLTWHPDKNAIEVTDLATGETAFTGCEGASWFPLPSLPHSEVPRGDSPVATGGPARSAKKR